MKFLSRLFHTHIMTSSDILMPRCCEATSVRFELFRHQRMSLKSLLSLRRPCPTFLGLQSASFSDSHSFLLLFFFILQIAFHFPPSSARLRLSPPPSRFLSYPSPCPSVISLLAFPSSVSSVFSSCCNFRARIQAREGDSLVNCTPSFVFMPRQSFLQGWGVWSSQQPLFLCGG